MGWRDFRTPTLMEKTELTEKTPQENRLIPLIPLIPPKGDSNFSDSLSFDRLTDEGKEIFKEYIGEMLFPKYGPTLTLEKAKSLAMELVSCFPGNLRENIKE